jgi:subtilisin family serine protease
MPVRYCLGIQHNDVAGAIDPGAGPFHLDPLREQLKRLVPELTFGELQHVPSFAWTNKKLATHVLTQLRFTGHDEAQRFHEALEKRLAAPDRKPIYGFGPDPPIHALEAWSPIGSGGGIFSDRDRAERLAGAAGLRDKYNQPVTGKGVNVVIADRGLSRSVVQATTDRMAARRGLQQAARQRVLGWTRHDRTGSADDPEPRYINPGRCGSDHGYMIARNILAIAPDAIIWDAPLLPSDDEPDAPPGPSSASQLFQFIKDALKTGKISSWDFSERKHVTVDFAGPVVLVNAWGVMDPESDRDLADQRLKYADNPQNFLVNDMSRLEAQGIDIVFAAGNCGEPCPDPRCGQEDRGPGCSILGMNAHPSVLTVGAVRADGLPLALSAQGPGRLAPALQNTASYDDALHKPDLCAPSHFREADDASEVNTGTSAACGFAAGIVAALRSVPAGRAQTPAQLRDRLRETAQPLGDAGWNARLGFGVINAAAALAKIEQ